MTGITITGTGRYLPERIVENEEFSAFIETSDEWIRSHTGIQRRRIALDEPTWYMGAEAAKQALQSAAMDAKQIDMIITTCVTSDYAFPSVACLVQKEIGAENAFCMDIAAACAGFAYALDMARRYLLTEDVENVLIVSAESLSQYTDYTDRGSCVLFADGAGACVLTRGEGRFSAFLGSDGNGAGALYAKYARKENPFLQGAPLRNLDPFPIEKTEYTVMEGHEVYRFATRAMPHAVRKACDKMGISPSEIDLFIPHQANIRIIQTAVKNLKIPMDNVYVNIQDYANTSSATIPICLDECIRGGRLQRGQMVCLVGFGAGLVYGAAVFEY